MRRFFFLIVFFSFSAQAVSVLDILGGKDQTLALQKELKKDVGSLFPSDPKLLPFIRAFESKNFHKALQAWEKLIAETAFATSSTGQALYAYLLFQNRFEILSLRHLLRQSHPKEIHPIVVNLWKKHIGKDHPVWAVFSSRINQQWVTFFDPQIIFQAGAKTFWNSKSKKDQEDIKFLLGLPLSEDVDVFSLEWSFVLSLIQQKDLPAATKVLVYLTSKTKNKHRRDQIHLNIGRLLADIKEEKAALSYYQKVRELSYFWLLAQEEMAWILFRKGNYKEAYSKASVFLYPGFQQDISPYMILVLSLSQLRNCNYQGFSKSLFRFKSSFSKRMNEINKAFLSKDDKFLIGRLLSFYNSKALPYEVALSDLPYALRRNVPLRNLILLLNYMTNQKNGRIKHFSLEKKEKLFLDQLKLQIKSRIRSLLKKEKSDILFALHNFHIAEAELLYQSQGFHSFKPFRQVLWTNKLSPVRLFYDNNPVLIFPFDSDEIWLDELRRYKAGLVKNCPRGNYVL